MENTLGKSRFLNLLLIFVTFTFLCICEALCHDREVVHPHITRDAFWVWPSDNNHEMADYLHGFEGGDDYRGTSIVEGAMEEDMGLRSWFEWELDIIGPIVASGDIDIFRLKEWVDHFWNPDDNTTWSWKHFPAIIQPLEEILPYCLTAFEKGAMWFVAACSVYQDGEKDLAYYYLGRAAHCLQDMGVPAHVHNDLHVISPGIDVIPEDIEDLVGDNYELWVEDNIGTLEFGDLVPWDLDSSQLKRDFPRENLSINNAEVFFRSINSKLYGFSWIMYERRFIEPYLVIRNPIDISNNIADLMMIVSDKIIGRIKTDEDKERLNQVLFKLCILFYNLAQASQHFPSDDSQGNDVNIDSTHFAAGWPEISQDSLYGENLRIISDHLMPETIKFTASLYRLFWETTHPSIITSPLRITPSYPPYYVGDTVTARFAITNQGPTIIKFKSLTVGGRGPDGDNDIQDFTPINNIVLNPGDSYQYEGTLSLPKTGKYHFFCAYQTLDENWNTNIDLGPGLTDADRVEDITVRAAAELSFISHNITPKIAEPGTTLTINYTINNPTPSDIDAILGCSIWSMDTGQRIDDPANDKLVSVSPGIGNYSRVFSLANNLRLGRYNVGWGLWSPDFTVAYDFRQSIGALTIAILPTDDTIPPQVSLITPNGGENWTVGIQQNIKWQAMDNVGVKSIDIQFSSDGVTNWSYIVKGIANTGQFDWIPATASHVCRIGVIAYDAAGNCSSDKSDGIFVISASGSPPMIPNLQDPGNISETGDFLIFWTDFSGADGYTLQEDTDPAFSSPANYFTTNTSKWINGKINGVYYYRVRTENEFGHSDWSNIADIEVNINLPPNVPGNPSPHNGAVDVSRENLTLSWTGGDPDGTVDYAVLFGTDPTDLAAYQGFGSGNTGEYFEIEFTLAAGTMYYWCVKAKDNKELTTVGPTWHFTTEYSYPDIILTDLTVTGTIAPGEQITLNLTVANEGTITAPGCQAFFYYSATSAGKDEKLFNLGTVIPELDPGSQTVISKEVTLGRLIAGQSYFVAEVDTQGYFDEKNLENNLVACAINYQDTDAPVISYLELIWGLDSQFQTGHEYSIVFEVSDDIGIDCLDFYYSTDNGTTWEEIITGFVIGSNGYLNAYKWTIPVNALLTNLAKVKMIARDTTGNETVGYSQTFSIIDGSAPSIVVTSPNGGEVWDLGSQHEITWEASSVSEIQEVSILLCWGGTKDYVVNITEQANNTNSYTWTLPASSAYVTNAAKIQIMVIDGNWNEAEDWSDEYFIINDPSAPPPPPWSMPEVITSVPPENMPYTTKNNMMPDIAADQNGDAHLVFKYTQDDISGIVNNTGPRVILQQVLYKKCVSSIWSSENIAYSLNQETDGNMLNYHSVKDIEIYTDQSNYPHLVWIDETNTGDGTTLNTPEVYYCYYNGSSWSIPLNVSNNNTQSGSPRMVIDSGDNVYIFWTDGVLWNPDYTYNSGERNVYYRRKTPSGNWSETQQLTYGQGSSFDVDIDNLDNLHVAFEAGYGEGVYYLKWDGNAWSSPALAIDLPEISALPSISCEPNGNDIHLVCCNSFGGNRIFYSHHDGNSWSSPEEINDPDLSFSVSYPSVTVDLSNNPHTVWEERSHGGVVYRTRQALEWSGKIQINLTSQYAEQDSSASAMSPDDILHVIWSSYYNGHQEIFHNYADVSSGIDMEAPSVTLTSPTTGQKLSIGEACEITWNASDNIVVASIYLKYTTDDEPPIEQEIASGETNDGFYDWIVPNITSSTVRIWIVASDATGNEGTNASGHFSISDRTVPNVLLSSPNGGETLLAQSQQAIAWVASDNVEVTSVDLFYSTDSGSTWHDIAAGETNDGIYPWTVPHSLSDNCKVKVVAYDSNDQMGSDMSDSVFSITVPNNPPYVPHSPIPANDAANVPINAELSWVSGDPDTGDTVTYDVYLDTKTSSMSLVSDSQSSTSYAPSSALSANTTYYWKIIASDGKHSSSSPTWSFTTGAEEIVSPSNLTATPVSSNRIDLSWSDNSSNEDGFRIERKEESDEAFTEIVILNPNIGAYSDESLYGGTTYVYRTRAYKGSMNSTYSNEIGATTYNSLPNTPTQPAPSDNSMGQSTNPILSWQGGDPDLGDSVTYDVYFGTNAEPPLVSDDQSGTVYSPGGLAYSKFYYWKVVATDSHGATSVSHMWSFSTETEPVPAAPSNLQLATESGSEVRVNITWSDNSDNELGFKIERKQGSDGVFRQICELGVNNTHFTDNYLIGRTTYHYRLRAFNSSGDSEYSQEQPVTTPIVYGDVTSDGVIDYSDVTAILQWGTELIGLTQEQLEAADVSGDGRVSAYDAGLVYRYIVGWISEFPVENGAQAAPDIATDHIGNCFLKLREALFKPGTELALMVSIEGANDVIGADMILDYDQYTLTPSEVSILSFSDQLIKHRAMNGHLWISIAASRPIQNGGVVEIKFGISPDAKIAASSVYLSSLMLNETTIKSHQTLSFGIVPYQFTLLQNYPNPFNPDTWIPYEIAENCEVSINIYNILGQLVRRLDLGYRSKGIYYSRPKAAYWDGRNEAGEYAASGVYFYHIKAGRNSAVRKMVVLQ